MQGDRIDFFPNCQLEWDKKRGVLYVHNKDTGATILRVCRIPACNLTVTLSDGQIDITHMHGIALPYEEKA